MRPPPADTEILSVGDLTLRVRELLETSFGSVWVEGEVGNFRVPGSGHWYFTLKDDQASLSAAMFRGQNRRVRFGPEVGMAVLCHGRVSVYPPRGDYQLIVDRIEPRGVGALQLAFEQLQRKLATEGLFDADRKQELPALPVRIGIVTSPTGAAIRDMLRVLSRRYRPLEILVAPTRVQGEGSAGEIAAALDLLNADGRSQLILCGRGGGSMEDLWAFNEEPVARAIARSRIPVISAVGHEVDVTIADLVADVRAATPSSAAEIAVPVRAELDALLDDLRQRLVAAVRRDVVHRRELRRGLHRQLIDPGRYVQIQSQRRDELEDRLQAAWQRGIQAQRDRIGDRARRLESASPSMRIQHARASLRGTDDTLARAQRHLLSRYRGALGEAAGRLDAMSPLQVLGRGFAVVTRSGRVVKNADQVGPGDGIDVKLHRGELSCSVIDRRLSGAATADEEVDG